MLRPSIETTLPSGVNSLPLTRRLQVIAQPILLSAAHVAIQVYGRLLGLAMRAKR